MGAEKMNVEMLEKLDSMRISSFFRIQFSRIQVNDKCRLHPMQRKKATVKESMKYNAPLSKYIDFSVDKSVPAFHTKIYAKLVG